MNVYNLVSLAGLFARMAIAWLFSANRRNLNFRCIVTGTSIQLILGTAVFGAPGSSAVLPDGSSGGGDILSFGGNLYSFGDVF